jgi:hypothetical protein
MRLLQEYEEQRRQFEASLREAEEESEREGTRTIAEVAGEARAIIQSRQK